MQILFVIDCCEPCFLSGMVWHNIFLLQEMIGLQEEINAFSSPLLVTAIHNGHALRPGISTYMAIDEFERLREEDPYTEYFADISESRLIVDTSRFEVDLNRPREDAVYRTPGQSWGIKVWKDKVPVSVWEYSYGEYDFFYNLLDRAITRFIDFWGYIIVYDIHSYNYLRNGKNSAEVDPEGNPEINLGTGSMDRQMWDPVVSSFMSVLHDYNYQGRKLHVAENIRFKGGYMAKWIHSRFPGKSCVLSIELKKIFMDEWTGAVNIPSINDLKEALKKTVPVVLDAAKGVAT